MGSICLLGFFLVVDGPTNLFLFVESYAQTATWAVLLAFPTLVLSYVLGLVAVNAADAVIPKLLGTQNVSEARPFVRIAAFGNEPITDHYLTTVRHQAFLQGLSPAFLILAVGCWSGIRWMGEAEIFGYVASAGSIALAVVCPMLATRLSKQAQSMSVLVEELVSSRSGVNQSATRNPVP